MTTLEAPAAHPLGAAPGSASGPKTGYWLQHTATGSRYGNYHLVHVGTEAKCLLDTTNGILMLRMLKRLKLQLPDIMGEPKSWTTDWVVRW